MQSAMQILRNTPEPIIKRAKRCIIVSYSVVEDRDAANLPHAYVLAGVICPPPTGTGRLHKVQLRLYAPGTKDAASWINCSCENNLYTWEVAQSLKGSGSIIHSNGKLPNIRNPNKVCACCKHLARLLTVAVNDKKVSRIIKGLPPEDVTQQRYPRPANLTAVKVKLRPDQKYKRPLLPPPVPRPVLK